jgi:hypothetical protein
LANSLAERRFKEEEEKPLNVGDMLAKSWNALFSPSEA